MFVLYSFYIRIVVRSVLVLHSYRIRFVFGLFIRSVLVVCVFFGVVFVLYSSWIRSVFVLCSYCLRIFVVLYACCVRIVFGIVLVFYSYCTRISFVLNS